LFLVILIPISDAFFGGRDNIKQSLFCTRERGLPGKDFLDAIAGLQFDTRPTLPKVFP
jgi:hypothetical protein